MIPALNFPAFMSGDRNSPIDGLNMNRAFPGKRDGSVTSMIADYLTTKIIPLSDVLVDIHSGGKTMMFSPFVTYQNVPNIGINQKAKEAALAFGAPICLEIVELDPDGMLDTIVATILPVKCRNLFLEINVPTIRIRDPKTISRFLFF